MDADFSCSDEGTDVTRPLETAVILSLFCDARTEVGDDMPEGTDKRGWWAEAYFDAPDTWGSKLWQVITRKATADTLVFAQRACERALEWLIDDGIARQVDVETWWIEGRRGYLGILVKVYKPNEVAPQYVGPWEIFFQT
jgi:phage gp46-like protein